MIDILTYQVKVAVALAAFYMFYRLLLSKETFHRMNRVVLLMTAGLSFVLPFCVITIRKTETVTATDYFMDMPVAEGGAIAETGISVWPVIMTSLLCLGAVAVIINMIVSIISIRNIIKKGSRKILESGEILILADEDTDPFSWMKYIVISRKDHETSYEHILIHEKAHIALKHSWDILFVDMLTALQWFNPAVWMLKSDLRAIHEYEADDAVLRSGVNIKEYQYLLIRKAVGKSGYSVANSFNHSTLKQRITMMSNHKSTRMSAWKALYVIPLVGLSLAATAETKVDYQFEDMQETTAADTLTNKVTQKNENPNDVLYIINGKKAPKEFDINSIDASTIGSITVLTDERALKEYGEEGKNGVILITIDPEKKPKGESEKLENIKIIGASNSVRTADEKDKPVRFIPVSEPIGELEEYSNFYIYNADKHGKEITYAEYQAIPSEKLSYLFIEHRNKNDKRLHAYMTDYNMAVHLDKCRKTTDINDERLSWVNETTEILIDGKWDNYEGYKRTLKFKKENIAVIEYYRYPEKKVKRKNLCDNGFVSIIFKKDYDKKIILTMM